MTTYSNLLWLYRTGRSRGRYTDDINSELIILSHILDFDDLPPEERKWIGRRYRIIRERIHNPTPRYEVMGARPGRPTRKQEIEISQREAIRALKSLLT